MLAGIALMFDLSGWAFFQSDENGIVGLTGEEIADERISLLDGVDAYAFADEVRSLPEVRKALVSYSLIPEKIHQSGEMNLYLGCFREYSVGELIDRAREQLELYEPEAGEAEAAEQKTA